MKKYHLIIKPDNETLVRICNDDENPIIKDIDCKTFGVGSLKQDTLRAFSIMFKENAETPAMKEQFDEPSVVARLMGRYESNYLENNLGPIIKFFKLMQTIDPIPLDAFAEIKARISLDLTMFTSWGLIEQMVMEGKHEAALKAALDANAQGDNEALPFLAQLYEENIATRLHVPANASVVSLEEDEKKPFSPTLNSSHNQGKVAQSEVYDQYITVLENFPKEHPLFINANKKLHEALVLKHIPSDEEGQLDLLERKFRSALISEQAIASNYFNQLCGDTGTNPQIQKLKGDPDTLLQIARQQREMRKEPEELRAYKEKTKKTSAGAGRSSTSAPHSKFFGDQNQSQNQTLPDPPENKGPSSTS